LRLRFRGRVFGSFQKNGYFCGVFLRKMNYLKSYCRIVGGRVCLNGRVVYEASSPTASRRATLTEIYESQKIDYRKFYKMDTLSRLGFLAAEMTLNDAQQGGFEGFDREQRHDAMAVALFNSSSSMEADAKYQKSIADFPSPSDFVYTLPNIVTGEIAIRNHIHGETTFYVLPEFRADMICDVINDMLYEGAMTQVLAGWLEVDAFSEYYDCLMLLFARQQNLNLTGLGDLLGFELITKLYNNQ